MFFHKSPRYILLMLLTAAMLLASCNVGAAPSPTLDVNAINTAIVGTTVAQFSAQFTQTALAMPQATNTPLPTFALPTETPQGAVALPATDANVQATVSFEITPTLVSFATPIPGFTQVASPVPAATQALGDACHNSTFEGDVTIPDGTVIKGGEDFVKIWKVRNSGTCKWDEGYSFVYIGGSSPDLDPYTFNFQNSTDFVAGGGAIDLPIRLTTPCTIGKYEGHWRMRNDAGYYFGSLFSVYVEVKEKGSNCK